MNTGVTLFHRTRQCLLHADDTVVLGRGVKRIAETVENTSVASQNRRHLNRVQNQVHDSWDKRRHEHERTNKYTETRCVDIFKYLSLLGNRHKRR
jgi:hypothetical protein